MTYKQNGHHIMNFDNFDSSVKSSKSKTVPAKIDGKSQAHHDVKTKEAEKDDEFDENDDYDGYSVLLFRTPHSPSPNSTRVLFKTSVACIFLHGSSFLNARVRPSHLWRFHIAARASARKDLQKVYSFYARVFMLEVSHICKLKDKTCCKNLLFKHV